MIEHAFEDEYGGTWWIPGHHSPEAAILSVVLSCMVDYGDSEAYELLTGGPADHRGRLGWTESNQMEHASELLTLPVHGWYRMIDEERFEPCEADDPNAMPWTKVCFE